MISALGPMGIEGYLLVCSKEHTQGAGSLPKDQYPELAGLITKKRKVLSVYYAPDIVVFEHSPSIRTCKAGSCIDHTHLHVVPTKTDILRFLRSRDFTIDQIDDICQIKERNLTELCYLYVEDQDAKKHFVNVNTPLESQYLRKVVAAHDRLPNWDWRTNPCYETIERTMNKLRGKFD